MKSRHSLQDVAETGQPLGVSVSAGNSKLRRLLFRLVFEGGGQRESAEAQIVCNMAVLLTLESLMLCGCTVAAVSRC